MVYFVDLFHETQELFFCACPYYEYVINIPFVEMDQICCCLLVFGGVRCCLCTVFYFDVNFRQKMLAMVGAALVPMAVPTF